MKKNILGAFALALLVLMGTGVAFGHWQDWVYINGYVNTGTMDVVPSFEGDAFDKFNYKAYNNYLGVATSSVRVDQETSTLYIALNNVYPGVCWWGTFNIENKGTVPAGFVNMTGTVSSNLKLEQVGNAWEWNVFYQDLAGAWTEKPIAVISVVQDTIKPTGPYGSNLCQIDPGFPVYFNVKVCFMNPLPQNATFNFQLALEFWNWNEVTNCPIPRPLAVS